VDDLLEQIALDPSQLAARRAEVIGLAIEHHLVTPFTAFVAVDQDIANPEAKSKILVVSQPLPEGLERQGFAPRSLSARPPMPAAAFPGMVSSAKSASFSLPFPISHLVSRKMSRYVQADTGAIPFVEAKSRQVEETTPEEHQAFLRWLARTQQLEGSWKGDVEITAAALLTFVRAGHTTQTGSYRQAVRRAYEWLKNAQASSFALFARALALHTLAQATGLPAHQASAAQICSGLPVPAALLEEVVSDLLNSVLSQDLSGPSQVATLDDLRLAGILNRAVVVPDEVRQTNDLSIAWTASLI
jgi:Ca-activated chloride channel family protein